jgi:hypothetical protein
MFDKETMTLLPDIKIVWDIISRKNGVETCDGDIHDLF